MKQTTEINQTGQEPQLAGGRRVGFTQAQQRNWTKDYLKQVQLVVSNSATLPPFKLPDDVGWQNLRRGGRQHN